MPVYSLNPSVDQELRNRKTRYRYSVFEHTLVFDETRVYPRSFIVLKNQYNVIVHFTCFHNYVDAYEKGVCIPLASDAKAKMRYICAMLNYILIDHYEEFGAGHIFSVTKDMLITFFQDYALAKQPDGGFRGRQSIEKCVSTVTSFFRKLYRKFGGYMSVSMSDLYTERIVFTKHGKMQKRLSPDFKVRGIATNKTIFRDIPTKVFQIIVHLAFRWMPEIAFAICLQAFAGLRPGEVCNVRQETSPLGSGLVVTLVDGVIRKVEIDLTAEYLLRSDGVSCGRIKKERRQRIYPAFLPAFTKAYEFHRNLLRDHFEPKYCPMFVNSRGKAMTYHDYRNKFRGLIMDYVRPALMNHADPECRLYGQLLYEHTLGPHALRHWFSVQLVLMGEDVAGLQYWRGDGNPESALLYLQNKGDLMKELSETNNLLADFMMSEGGMLYGRDS